MAPATVITSYSIHYTKLYDARRGWPPTSLLPRTHQGVHGDAQAGERLADVPQPAGLLQSQVQALLEVLAGPRDGFRLGFLCQRREGLGDLAAGELSVGERP